MPIKNRRWKNIITLMTVLTVFVLLFEIFPDYSDIISSTVQLIFNENAEEQLARNEARLKQLNMENQELKSNAGNLLSNLDNNNISAIISLLDESAERSNCKTIKIKPGVTQKKDNLFVQPITVELSSGYERLYNYIRFLENSVKVVRIRKLSIKESKGKDLKISADLEAYLNL